MAAKKKEEESAPESGSRSKGLLNSFLKEKKDSHYNFVESQSKFISTGSLQLDSLIKIRTGSIVRLAGKGSELGKTSQSLVLAKNYMDAMPKSKTLFIKAEARLSPEMVARSGHKFTNKSEDWEYGTIFVYSGNIFEDVADLIEKLLPAMHDEGEHLCIIIDSLDGLILRDDNEKSLWGGKESMKVAGIPLLSKALFRRISLQINHFDALMLITCQYSTPIKLDPYSKVPERQTDAAGGNSINHQSDITLSYSTRNNSDYIYEHPEIKPDPVKNRCIGVYATIDIKKSSTDVTGSRVKVPIAKGRIGNAIWREKEVVDMLISFELISRKGAWYNFNESFIQQAIKEGVEIQPQHQGMNSVYKYIEDNKLVFEWLYAKMLALISD